MFYIFYLEIISNLQGSTNNSIKTTHTHFNQLYLSSALCPIYFIILILSLLLKSRLLSFPAFVYSFIYLFVIGLDSQVSIFSMVYNSLLFLLIWCSNHPRFGQCKSILSSSSVLLPHHHHCLHTSLCPAPVLR